MNRKKSPPCSCRQEMGRAPSPGQRRPVSHRRGRAGAVWFAGKMPDRRTSAWCLATKSNPGASHPPAWPPGWIKPLTFTSAGIIPAVIVSGGFGKEGWDEAQVMADYLAARGVPRSAILIDHEGNNTYLTALHTAQIAQETGLSKLRARLALLPPAPRPPGLCAVSTWLPPPSPTPTALSPAISTSACCARSSPTRHISCAHLKMN